MVEVDHLKDVANLADAHATLGPDIAVPDGAVGIEAHAVGGGRRLGPDPSFP
jgi:hypothetical protein